MGIAAVGSSIGGKRLPDDCGKRADGINLGNQGVAPLSLRHPSCRPTHNKGNTAASFKCAVLSSS